MDEKLLWALKQKGIIEILVYMYVHGKVRYPELKKIIKKESTLIRAINILIQNDLAKRNILDEKYRPTEYMLTEKGLKIAGHLYKIFQVEK